jgi:N-acetylglucosamine kinase-like BadF-type ATPase
MARIYVGIDGGATKTHGVATDEEGRVLCQATVGPSNYQVVGLELAQRHACQLLADLVSGLWDGATLSALVAGVAGLDGPQDQEPFRQIFSAALAPVEARMAEDFGWRVVNDATGAWAGALQGRPGGIVISGSGAIALAVNAAGEVFRSDGWGYWIGDEGSGFEIGRRGMRAGVRVAEGRGPETALWPALRRYIEELGATSWQHWLTELNGRAEAHGLIARFAPAVTQAGAEGDEIAGQILAQAGTALGITGASALCMAGLAQEGTIATVGSLFTHSPLVRQAFVDELARQLPGASVIWPQLSPAEGAALLARQPHLVPRGSLEVVGST